MNNYAGECQQKFAGPGPTNNPAKDAKNVIIIIKSRRMRWTVHVALMGANVRESLK
jgi:hypothetical protein